MKFEYQAKNTDGTIERGEREAADKFTLAHEMKKEGKLLLIAKSSEKTNPLLNIFSISFSFGNVPVEDKIVFARNLAAMVHAGVGLTRAMSILEKQTERENFKKIISDINETITKGSTLSESLRKYPKIFSEFFVALVRVGEETGRLSESLKEVTSYMEKTTQLVRKIKGVMIYPSIVVCVIILIGILMLTYVVPTLTSTFKEMKADLPASTKFIIAVSDALSQHTALIFSLLAVFIALMIIFVKSKIGGRIIDIVLLKIPVVGKIVKEVNAARTARTLSSFFSAGVSVSQSLKIVEDVLQNHLYKEVMANARAGIEEGKPLSLFFKEATNLYPSIVGEMVAVGEETGTSGEMFKSIADFYEEEVDRKTKDLSTIIEPVIMVFVGTAVGFFALAMISPIYSLSDKI